MAELATDDLTNFLDPFSLNPNEPIIILRVEWTDLCHIRTGHRLLIGAATKVLLDFSYIAPF